MLEQSQKKMTRMEFLKLIGVSSASFFASGLLNEELFADVASNEDTFARIRKNQCVVYHTSTRKRKACNACKRHALNKIFSSREAADTFRAHPGCNCKIVEEKINWRNYVGSFWPSSKGGTAVYDKRWGWPPPLPKDVNLDLDSF